MLEVPGSWLPQAPQQATSQELEATS